MSIDLVFLLALIAYVFGTLCLMCYLLQQLEKHKRCITSMAIDAAAREWSSLDSTEPGIWGSVGGFIKTNWYQFVPVTYRSLVTKHPKETK